MIFLLWTIHIILLLAIAVVLWKKQTALKRWFWPALLLKLLAGIALGLLYTHYYHSGDTFIYFRDATRLSALAREDFSSYGQLLFGQNIPARPALTLEDPRAFFMARIVSVFSLITGDSYWITGLYFSLVSFLASWFLVLTIVRYIPGTRRAAVIAFLFVPSIVFWTSGLLKESLAMAGLFYLTALFLKLWFGTRLRWTEYLLAMISLLIFWKLKYYYVAGFVPIVAATFLYRAVIGTKLDHAPARQALIWLVLLLLPLALITLLHPNFYIHRIFDVMVANNTSFVEMSEPGDAVIFEDLRPTFFSVLLNAPWALASGLFRPLFWEADSIIQLLAGMENTFLLLLFISALRRYRKYATSQHRPLILASLAFIVVLCVFITISAPNLGTLSRYRVGYLSFFVFIILCENPVVDYAERSISRLVSH